MPRFDPSAPQRLWLKKNGRKRVNPVAAVMTAVGALLGFVSICFGGMLLRLVAGTLFLAGVAFLDGFRLRDSRPEEDDDLPGPHVLY